MLTPSTSKEAFSMTLCEKLIDLRRKAGLSQEQMAQQLDVSRQAVSKWETGVSQTKGY
jgi:DNA-binding XRE family transcriptional regulator